jgi:archaellum biogenesis ATPase FlaH
MDKRKLKALTIAKKKIEKSISPEIKSETHIPSDKQQTHWLNDEQRYRILKKSLPKIRKFLSPEVLKIVEERFAKLKEKVEPLLSIEVKAPFIEEKKSIVQVQEKVKNVKMIPEETTIEENQQIGKYNFNYILQKTIVAMIIFDIKNFLLYKQIIKPEYFDNITFQDIVNIIFTFHGKYNRVLSYEELLEEIYNFGESLILRGRAFPVDDYLLVIQDIYENPQKDKYDYTRDKVIEFAKDRAILQVADELEKMLKEKKYSEIRKRMEQALDIGIEENPFKPLIEFDEKELEWLWPRHFPKGAINLISGDVGTGKSFFLLKMATLFTTGALLPQMAGGEMKEKYNVAYFAYEDPIETVVKKRFKANYGDEKRFFVREYDPAFDLTDLNQLKKLIKDIPHPLIAIFDTVLDFTGDTGINRPADVRKILIPLAKFCEKERIDIIASTHHNKSTQLKTIYRVMGSQAFPAVARSVWEMTKIPEGEDNFIYWFRALKLSWAKEPLPLAFRIKDNLIVMFDETIKPDMDKIERASSSEKMSLQEIEMKNKTNIAEDFLENFIDTGITEMEASDVLEEAVKQGIKRGTLFKAAKNLKIIISPVMDEEKYKIKKWKWIFPKKTL